MAFMGGDADPAEVLRLAEHIKGLKTAWYSGRMHLPQGGFDYVKIGPYIEEFGGLKSPTTNQRLYKRVGENWEDITSVFWRKTFE